MPWVKLDDRAHSAPAFLAAGIEATGLYALGLSYCAHHGAPHIPAAWVRSIPRGKRAAVRLVEHSLWRAVPDGFEPVLEVCGIVVAKVNYSGRERVPRWMRRLIFARDHGICQLCSRPVIGAFHVDHVLPSSVGGATIPENLQLAHPACNIRKGNRV